MSKLLKMKHWVTLPDAARHLSAMFDEAVDVADVLQLGLDGRLKLSVVFDDPVKVQPKKLVSEADARKALGLPEDAGKREFGVRGCYMHDGMVLIDDGPRVKDCFPPPPSARGLFDLPMIGGEVLGVERICRAAQGLKPGDDAINPQGALVVGPGGVILQVLTWDGLEYHYSWTLPDDVNIVVRPSELLALANRETEGASTELAQAEAARALQAAELRTLKDAHAKALQELQDRRQREPVAPQEWAKLLDDLGDLKGRYIHEQERLRATAAELAAQSDTLKRAQADRERRESEADEEYRRMADELARLSGAHVRTLQELQQARKELEQTHLEYSRLLRAESELRDGDALVQQKVQELLEELARMQQEVRAQPSSASPEVERRSGGDRRKGWPWGMHETERLRHLAAAAARFWVNFDPADSTTAPTNEDVSAWLQRECGQTKRAADAMATILRADGLPTGPRV